MTFKKKYTSFLVVIFIFAFTQRSYSVEKDSLFVFPHGFTPLEIGTKVAERFLTTKHMLHDKKWIHYAEVCTWYGALKFAEESNDSMLKLELENRFLPFFSSEKELLPIMNHVDLNMFGCLPLELYNQTHEEKYLDMGLAYADSQWVLPEHSTTEQIELSDAGLSWQTRFWIDDMFMINILQSQAYLATLNIKYIDRAAKEMVIYLNRLQRPNGLFYHAPDVPFYWGRGNGWMAAGMTELLKNLPANNIYRQQILFQFQKMMSTLKKYQREDGMWGQLVDDPQSWAETSGTAMFAYAIITGVKRGWINKQEFSPIARKAWIALVSNIDEKGDVTNVCQGTNKENSRQYYLDRKKITGDMHGQAPVLWCATALLE